MTSSRSHLVERAVEAMGGLGKAGTAPTPLPAGVRPVPVEPTPVPPPAVAAPAAAMAATPTAAPAATPAEAATARPVPTPPPVIGLDLLRKAGLVAGPASGRSRVSEEISVAQHQVLRGIVAADRAQARSRVVLVTSAHSGEGKTFTALNVAASLAAGGSHPVVLVDVDGKPGSISALLGVAGLPGLRDLATDPARRPPSAVLATEIKRLSVLPYGASVSGAAPPPGTALATAVRRLAEALPDHVVLLDSPPCLSASEAGTLATVAGQVVLVVEAERTQRSEVEASLDLVDACPNLQLLLNKARLTDSDTFGAYAEAYASA